jgi:hypothetical protein
MGLAFHRAALLLDTAGLPAVLRPRTPDPVTPDPVAA